MNFSYISPATVLLYLLVFFISVFFAFVTEYSRKQNKVNIIFYIFSFLPSYLLLSFSACGADYENYNKLFEIGDSFESVDGYDGMERGFTLLVYIIRIFISNVNIYNFILAFIFLFLIYSTIYKLRDRINIGWAILIFMSISYFQYLDLKRICIAAAIIFSSIPFWLEKRNKETAFILIIACLFHISSIIAFLPFFLDVIVSKYLSYKKILFFSLALTMILIMFRNILLTFQLDDRHSEYGLLKDSSIGMIQFFYHIPLYFLIKWNIPQRLQRIQKLSILCLICSLSLGLISYFFLMIGRAYIHFLMAFMFFPYIMLEYYKARRKKYYLFIGRMAILFYCGVRLYIYFSEYLILDQISPYITIYDQIF